MLWGDGMVNQPEKKVKLLNQIEFNILEKSSIKNARCAKEIARHWLRLSR
jgi:hypothetical protein